SAMDRLRAKLRSELLRAARAHSRARTRRLRRLRLAALAAALTAATAGLAVAAVGPGADVDYECPAAERQHEGSEIEVGPPVVGPGAPETVEPEEPGVNPGNPCD
ncbi:MAG: hypothetical protein ACRDJL_03180, partial [Actinomycetota bacterium]